MQNKDAADLLNKYALGTCSEEEKAIVETWYLKDSNLSSDASSDRIRLAQQKNLNLIMGKRNSYSLKSYLAAAAAILIFLSTGLYLYINYYSIRAEQEQVKIIGPGSNKAILTLADGSKIILNNLAEGDSITQSGIKIRKTQDGELVYTASAVNGSAGSEPQYNTIETPRGGKYQVNLPDGTKVWLNAASSLHYPLAFSVSDRTVELSGEGYFEVSKDKTRPFSVVAGKQKVEVLGTHFNLSGYPDEPAVKTTLLEGSIRVSSQLSNTSKMLIPGEQSVFTRDGFSVKIVDASESIDWKNETFSFDDEEIALVMNKISRWYDVDIDYKGDLSKIKITGFISRTKNLQEVLKVLQSTGKINFKVTGRRITVMP